MIKKENRLELIPFYDNNSVYIFIKEKGSSNDEYHNMRMLANEQGKEKMLYGIKIDRYFSLLKNGHEYNVIYDMINQSKDFVERYGYDGMSWLFSEKSALNAAYLLEQSFLINSHVQGIKKSRKKI